MDKSTDELSTQDLRRDLAGQRDDIGRDLEAIGDRLSPGRVADRSRERARRRVDSWRERVMGIEQQTKTQIGSTIPSPSDTSSMVEERVQGSPIAVGLVAFGLGFIAGSVLPASRTEQDLAKKVEPQVERVAGELADTAREAADHLKPAVQEEAAAVKDDATTAVSNSTEAARAEASAAAQDIRSS